MANSIYILFSMDEFVTEQELKMSIAYLIKDTPYDIIDFDYSSKYFGNVIIILTNHEAHNTFRFISDRGDVHVEQEFNGYWLDKGFHPRIENDKTYLTLLNAITDFLK